MGKNAGIWTINGYKAENLKIQIIQSNGVAIE